MFKTHQFAVSPVHTLYIEERGNEKGVPILFLHGGPGTGLSESSCSYFDPYHYRIILFDQRGAGKSTPFACTEENTTWELIEDIEKIRKMLKIESWLVFGGSWGATLATVYAENYPQRVMGLIIRGILLGNDNDLSWLLQTGAPHIWPKEWEDFISLLPLQDRENIIEGYWKLLQQEDKKKQQDAARSWTLWEARNLTLMANMKAFEDFFNEKRTGSIAAIELHYFRHKLFLEQDYILKNAYKLEGIPGKILHGRYDTICPFSNSWKLHKAWKGSELIAIECAGHAGLDPAIHKALVEATEAFKKIG